MNEISLDFHSNLQIPPLCEEWESPSGEIQDSSLHNANAKSSDIRIASETHMNSPPVILQDTENVESHNDNASVQDLCQEFRNSRIFCKTDIFFDDVINDVYSISKDIFLTFSMDTSLLVPLPSINYDSGLGILVHSCALKIREESYTFSVPNPQPRYFEIHTQDNNRDSASEMQTLLNMDFDMIHVFYMELGKIQRTEKLNIIINTDDHKILHSADSPKLDVMNRALMENHIAAYDMTLKILLICLGFMMIIFFDLYLHLQTQSSQQQCKGITPLVAVFYKAICSTKCIVNAYLTTGYKCLRVWKDSLIRYCTRTRTCVGFKRNSIHDIWRKRPRLGLQVFHATRSRIIRMWSSLKCSYNQGIPRCQWKFFNDIFRCIIHIRDRCSRAICFSIAKFYSPLELSISISFLFHNSIAIKHHELKRAFYVRLRKLEDEILLVIGSMLYSLREVAGSLWYRIICNMYVIFIQKWERKVCVAMKDESNTVLLDSLLLSPECNYETYPGLAFTGCYDSKTPSFTDLQDINSSVITFEVDTPCILRGQQLSFYEDSIVPNQQHDFNRLDDFNNSLVLSSTNCYLDTNTDPYEITDGMRTFDIKTDSKTKYLSLNKDHSIETSAEAEIPEKLCINSQEYAISTKIDYTNDIATPSESPQSIETSDLDNTLLVSEIPLENAKFVNHTSRYFRRDLKCSLEYGYETTFYNRPITECRIITSDDDLSEIRSISSTRELDSELAPINFVYEESSYDGNREIDDFTTSTVLLEAERHVADNPIISHGDKMSQDTAFCNIGIRMDEDRKFQHEVPPGISSRLENMNLESKRELILSKLRKRSVDSTSDECHGLNEELLEKLKLRYISTDDEADKSHSSNSQIANFVPIMNDRLSSKFRSQSSITEKGFLLIDTDSRQNRNYSHHTEEGKQKFHKESASSGVKSPTSFKNKDFTELMARWGNTESQASVAFHHNFGSASRVLPPPRKIESPFFNREQKTIKVKKMTPVKGAKFEATETPVTERYTGEDPLSFLNTLLE